MVEGCLKSVLNTAREPFGLVYKNMALDTQNEHVTGDVYGIVKNWAYVTGD
jgi:hypothetical protein